ncbi:MAG: glutamine--fructose-6-phosphate transaminase (isomerizing) [Bacteroidales bacterium]|nr:glutamine--fructose-6-phosphate transaminase (isomerizing) [Bacteroidales bacterium]
MCGIIGYVGNKQAYPVLINGLYRLEYRGYDSAGVAIMNEEENELFLYKSQGKVSQLDAKITGKKTAGTIGIAHTRWATHGEPNNINAHPHSSQSGNLVIIHNGIIENYISLKKELIGRGYSFKSETDTEVLIQLIEDIQLNENLDLFEAVRSALNQVIGAYAILVFSRSDPDTLIAARKSSPLVIGKKLGEYYIASDPTPIVEYTKDVVYLKNEEIAIIKRNQDLRIKTIRNKDKTPYFEKLEMSLSALEKKGYEHFMLKEIFEQPHSVSNSMRGRLNARKGSISLGGISDYLQKMTNANRILIIACGTSWHAGLVGEYLFEDLARIPVEVEYASEFRYRNPVISENDIIIVISQSGETADSLAAIELAKSKGATIIGICNVVGSSISRASHAGSYTHAGPEIGVASTKAFTAQVAILTMMALLIGRKKGTITRSKYFQYIHELSQIPKKIKHVLKSNDDIRRIAENYKNTRNFLYLGRGYNFPVALEGALKLKEISYIHAEGYHSAELKHGPIALLEENMPVIALLNQGPGQDKSLGNVAECKARSAPVLGVITEGDEEARRACDHVIEIPACPQYTSVVPAAVALQLFSYHVARIRGCSIDQPRNLAKSVTVE